MDDSQNPKQSASTDAIDEESLILERLEDSDDLSLHAHHALVHNPFSWSE